MRGNYFLYLVLFLVLAWSPAYAELYKGIGPFDKLPDIKNKFPGTEIARIYPAWAHENDVLYSLTGPGISGAIIIKFYDPCPYCKKQVEDSGNKTPKDFYTNRLVYNLENDLVVSWVRWVPDQTFPLDQLIKKYGRPEESGSSDENKPYQSWRSKGLTAILSEDGKMVISLEFAFTNQDILDSLEK
jgi:hypothetical protein